MVYRSMCGCYKCLPDRQNQLYVYFFAVPIDRSNEKWSRLRYLCANRCVNKKVCAPFYAMI